MDKKGLFQIGIFKTLYVNFFCCKLRDAIHLPIIVARNVNVFYCKRNSFSFVDGCRMGVFTVGFNRKYNSGGQSVLNIQGSVVVHGKGMHVIGAGSNINVSKNGILEIGDNFCCTGDSHISVDKRLIIGNKNIWAYYNVVMDNDGHNIYDVENNKRINEPLTTIFCDNIWMGCRCTVLKGSYIASNTVIASESVLTRKSNSYSGGGIIGTGYRVIRPGIKWTI